jgi:hypothetical protein
MEAKGRALDEIAARQQAANKRRKQGVEQLRQIEIVSRHESTPVTGGSIAADPEFDWTATSQEQKLARRGPSKWMPRWTPGLTNQALRS